MTMRSKETVMNEIVKPNTAMANAENLFDVRSRVESIANDVDLLFRLVEDALGATDSVEPVSDPVAEKPEPVVLELGRRDLARVKAMLGQWMTLSMLQHWLGAKSRSSAENFLWRLKSSEKYVVEAVPLNGGYRREKMYLISAKDAA